MHRLISPMITVPEKLNWPGDAGNVGVRLDSLVMPDVPRHILVTQTQFLNGNPKPYVVFDIEHHSAVSLVIPEFVLCLAVIGAVTSDAVLPIFLHIGDSTDESRVVVGVREQAVNGGQGITAINETRHAEHGIGLDRVVLYKHNAWLEGIPVVMKRACQQGYDWSVRLDRGSEGGTLMLWGGQQNRPRRRLAAFQPRKISHHR